MIPWSSKFRVFPLLYRWKIVHTGITVNTNYNGKDKTYSSTSDSYYGQQHYFMCLITTRIQRVVSSKIKSMLLFSRQYGYHTSWYLSRWCHLSPLTEIKATCQLSATLLTVKTQCCKKVDTFKINFIHILMNIQ